jgi:hypothetical protein
MTPTVIMLGLPIGGETMPKLPREKVDLVVVAWYERDDYDAVRALGKDGGGMEPTFDEWHQLASVALIAAARSGVRVERMPVKSGDLAAWLRSENVESNQETRARYAWDLAAAKYANKQ